VDRARRYNLVLALLMVDLDHFKRINRHAGHLVGDTVLRQLGRCSCGMRGRWTRFARYGGEEFVILLPETAAHGAMMFADRMRQASLTSLRRADAPGRITVSVGSPAPDPAVDTPESLSLWPTQRCTRQGGRRNVVRQVNHDVCPKCHTVYTGDARFCPQDGSQLVDVAAPAPAAAPADPRRCARP